MQCTKRDVHKKLGNSTYHKKALFNYLVSYGRPLDHGRPLNQIEMNVG